eukprot:7340433-Lingulodinium_polyedra.AAC.1
MPRGMRWPSALRPSLRGAFGQLSQPRAASPSLFAGCCSSTASTLMPGKRPGAAGFAGRPPLGASCPTPRRWSAVSPWTALGTWLVWRGLC